MPLSSVSNRANARRISSRGSRAAIRFPAIVWKACRVSSRRPGGMLGSRTPGRAVAAVSGGMPCVVKSVRISGLGRSNPRALRATLNSW